MNGKTDDLNSNTHHDDGVEADGSHDDPADVTDDVEAHHRLSGKTVLPVAKDVHAHTMPRKPRLIDNADARGVHFDEAAEDVAAHTARAPSDRPAAEKR
jgi:hypothetical protein